ncbi:MAG: DUF4097 family beta strand repeat-containing protein [Fidelibacterota bacterium]
MKLGILLFLLSIFLFGQSVTYEYELNSVNDSLLILNSIDGDIIIHGSDQNIVRIVQKIKSDFEEKKLNRGELFSDGKKLEFVEQPGISFKVEKTYDIVVPNHININLDLLGGTLEIKQITGSVKVEKISGMINASDIKGNTYLSTGNGNLTFDNIQGDIYGSVLNGNAVTESTNGSLKLESGSGDLFVTEHRGSLEIKTFAGNCHLQNTSGDSIKAVTRGGDISVRSISTVEGIFNTMAGDIMLDNIDGNIFSETYGGVISGSNWTGDFKLQNYSGSISANDIRGILTINSFYGNVEINRFSPDDNIGDTSLIKIVSGDLYMTYTGDYVGLDLKTQGGSISSNVVKTAGKSSNMGIYHPEMESNKINIILFNGSIVINKGDVND